MRVRTESEQRCKSTPSGKTAQGSGLFGFMNHGGERKGSGRKAAKGPDGKRVHNPHSTRESFGWNRPVHVTVCVRAGLPSLRGPVLAPVVLKCLEPGNEREGFRLVHFSVQTTHYHAICEAEGPAALAAAIKGLNVRIAKAINERLGLKGKVIADRYHLEVLRSPTQVRNAIRYVLRNGEKHGVHVAMRHGDPRPCPDPLSSAAWFGYWKEGELNVLATQSAVTVVKPAQCFLLREGLQRFEPLSLLDAPPGRTKIRPMGEKRSMGRAAQRGTGRALRPAWSPREPPATLRGPPP
jgi:putative transposase